MSLPSPLLEKSSLERLERLVIRWEKSFSGLLGGSNSSRYAGVGNEFLDHRHFQKGDDLRSVNWRVYLRLEHIFLKMFQTEPRTPIHLLVDCSNSMTCGASGQDIGESKFTYSCRLAAALCYISLVRLETIVLQPFNDSLYESFRADGGRHRYARAASFLENLSAEGCSDFRETTRQFLSRGASPGLTILISDFIDESECYESLNHLADFGHELLLVHVASPEDCAPMWRGELEFVDAESGYVRRMNVNDAVVDEYTAAYAQHCRKLEYAALRGQGRCIHLNTRHSIVDSLYGAMTRIGSFSVH